MKLAAWFDGWVRQGPFTPRDLGLYRILFALLLEFYVPNLRALQAYPDSLYDPPPGPFELLHGFPADPVLGAVEIVTLILITSTLFGLYTRISSIGLSLALAVGYGLTFSVGKLDHVMVLIIVPAVLSFARWGDHFSIDALKRRRVDGRLDRSGDAARDLARSPAGQPQWPLRFLALSIGVAFCTAAVPKLAHGWLSFAGQATYGYQVQRDVVRGSPGWISAMLVDLHVPMFWEALDWGTVLIECSVVLCVLSWRSWRIALAVLSIFHLSIALSLGIYFTANVLAYGAFVSWGMVRTPAIRLSPRARGLLIRVAPALVLAGAGVLWLLADAVASVRWMAGIVIVFAAAGVGVCYLGRQVIAVSHAINGRRTVVNALEDKAE